MKVTIVGAPRTKKNRPQAVLQKSRSGKGQPCPYCRRPVVQQVFPSKPWREWVKEATVLVDNARLVRAAGGVLLLYPPSRCSIDRRRNEMTFDSPLARPWTPIAEPVNCAAIFYRDRDQGDLIGFLQGVADLLEGRGVLADDKWIEGWDGSRLALTDGRPRVELELTARPRGVKPPPFLPL